MAEKSDQIRRELENTRARVGSTIAALERKVNPRHILDDHPLAMVGVAFGTGVLLATTGAAKRAVGDVRVKIQDSAEHLNSGAAPAFDRILSAITHTASTAITAKITELIDTTMNGSQSRGTSNNKSITTSRAA